MKIAVIAANGRSGKIFVQTALENGHVVRAGVYGIHDFSSNKNLEIIDCDATSYENISSLIKGCDAVVSLIGHGKKSPANVQTNAIRNLTKAVTGSKIRVVSLTGTGVRFDGDKPSLIDYFLNFGIKFVDPKRVNDGINHTVVLKNSHTSWTLIRVLKLTNSKPKKYSISFGGPAKLFTSRLEVANAILDVLNSDEYIKKAVVISSA